MKWLSMLASSRSGKSGTKYVSSSKPAIQRKCQDLQHRISTSPDEDRRCIGAE